MIFFSLTYVLFLVGCFRLWLLFVEFYWQLSGWGVLGFDESQEIQKNSGKSKESTKEIFKSKLKIKGSSRWNLSWSPPCSDHLHDFQDMVHFSRSNNQRERLWRAVHRIIFWHGLLGADQIIGWIQFLVWIWGGYPRINQVMIALFSMKMSTRNDRIRE